MSKQAVCRKCGGSSFVEQGTVTAFYRGTAHFVKGSLEVEYEDTDYSDNFVPADTGGWWCQDCDAYAANLIDLVEKGA